jgi:hypothetical protein
MVSGTPGNPDPAQLTGLSLLSSWERKKKDTTLQNFCYNRSHEATTLELRSEGQLQTSAVSVRQGEVMPSCSKT